MLSPNAGKYGPAKTPYLDVFLEVKVKVKLERNESSALRKIP